MTFLPVSFFQPVSGNKSGCSLDRWYLVILSLSVRAVRTAHTEGSPRKVSFAKDEVSVMANLASGYEFCYHDFERLGLVLDGPLSVFYRHPAA